MNIFKTFETYLKEPLSILRNNFFQIVSLETDNIFENKPSVDVTLSKDKAQITVINNRKLYNLLSLVTQKANLKKTKEEEQESQQKA